MEADLSHSVGHVRASEVGAILGAGAVVPKKRPPVGIWKTATREEPTASRGPCWHGAQDALGKCTDSCGEMLALVLFWILITGDPPEKPGQRRFSGAAIQRIGGLLELNTVKQSLDVA